MIPARSIATAAVTVALLCTSSALSGQRSPTASQPAAGRSSQTLSSADTSALASAVQAYEAGNLSAARPVLLQLAARYPQHAEIQTVTGMTLAELGDVSAALPFLERAHRLAPQDTQILANLAVALIKTDAAEKAVALLSPEIAQHPQDATLRLRLAQAEMAAGDAAAAATSYTATAKLMQDGGAAVDDDMRQDWAVALLAANEPAQAVAVLQNSSGVAASGQLQEVLGEAEERLQHYELAAQHFKRAAELDPSEANLYGYGVELMRHWTFPSAIQVLSFALQRYPESDRLRSALGIAYYGNANYTKAVPVFAGLLAKEPNSSTAADLLGRSCSALGGAQQDGCTSLRSFAEKHPDNAQASLFAGVAILHQAADEQDTEAAERLLKNALRVDPKLADAWYQLAVLQQTRGDWAGSIDLLQHALRVRPDYPEAHYRMARAYSHMGKHDEAQKEIALQQKYAGDEKAEEQRRMKEVTTFLVKTN